MKPQLQQIRVDSIELDRDVQSRARHDLDAIREFSEAMNQGKPFPPIVVFTDGDRYWCGDGFHRVQAAREAEWTHIAAVVREGGKREAVLHSVGANVTHGIRRTNADKRRAVMLLLRDPEWSRWSSREIARRAGVSHPFVESVRAGVTGNGYQSTKRKGADGRTTDTANIGASQALGKDAQPDEDATGELKTAARPTSLAGQSHVTGLSLACQSRVTEGTQARTPALDSARVVADLDSAAKDYLEFLIEESRRLVDWVAQGRTGSDDVDEQLVATLVAGANVLDQTRGKATRIAEIVRRSISEPDPVK